MANRYMNVRVHNIPNHQRSGKPTMSYYLKLVRILQKGKRDIDKDMGKNELRYTVDGNVN